MTLTATPTQSNETPTQGPILEVLAPGQTPSDGSMMNVPLNRIQRNPDIDPRQHRNKARVAGILESVKEQGIIQPIVIRPIAPENSDAPDFEVVAGNTRFEVAVEVGLSTIPAVIRHLTPREAVIMAGVENMQRADLSPVEEGLHAARLLASSNNDYEEVCKLLGWTEARLKSRIMLTHVTPFIQDSLVQGQLKLGHVELLSGIPRNQQDRIAQKIIERGMTVAETKEGLARGTRQLAKACFPLDDCQGCRYNSSTVMDMFASAEGASKDFCSNAACWDEKTAKALDIIVTDAKENYGTVLRDKEVVDNSHTHLEANGEDGVGVEQKASCASCQHYGCVISTTFGTEGVIYGDQCFNLDCHAEKVTAYRSALNRLNSPSSPAGAAVEPAPAPANGNEPASTPAHTAPETDDATPGQKPAKNEPAALTPASLKRGIKQEAMSRFVRMGEEAITGSTSLSAAIALLTLHATFRRDFSEEVTERANAILKRIETDANALSPINAEVLDNKALLLARLSPEALLKAMTELASLTVWRKDTAQAMERHGPYQHAARYAQAYKINRARHLAVTPEYLKAQTKAGIIADCKRSGFAEAYDAQHGEKAFAALSKGKAGDLIAAITGFVEAGDFDFHGYEPIGFDPVFYFKGI